MKTRILLLAALLTGGCAHYTKQTPRVAPSSAAVQGRITEAKALVNRIRSSSASVEAHAQKARSLAQRMDDKAVIILNNLP